MESGAIEEEDRDEHGDVHAFYLDTQCHRCKGWGHVASSCPSAPVAEKGWEGGSHGWERDPRKG